MTDGLVWYISIVARYNCSHFNYTHSTMFPIQYAGIILHSSSHDNISISISFPQPNIVFTARCYASAVLAMALCPPVRLSVCLSVTSRCSTKTAKRRITQTTPHDSAGTLTPKISAKFDRGHPLRGRRMQVGWVKISDFWPIAGYISKTL